MPTANDLRQGFLDYFKGHGHTSVPSSSLIPQADPTLLFTNAGMNQFKGVFLGEETRPYKRAITVQKCLRAGGKHNDLENVGYTARHHTFFEMLGNFSFGNYFKEDAIRFAWDFLTRVVGLQKNKLWVTIFQDDDQAFDLWKKIGMPASAQGVHSNYDTELRRPILRAIADTAGRRYGVSPDDDRSMRVIADHLRGMVFMVADGVLPSNEGRGYVLRRIIRRAGRYGRLLGLGLDGPFLHRLTESVVAGMKAAYPELEQARDTVRQVTAAEEERFLARLEKGEPLLAAAIASVLKANQKTIPGQKLFELYDTYGYPLDLAADSARDKGLTLDLEGF